MQSGLGMQKLGHRSQDLEGQEEAMGELHTPSVW